MKLVGAHPQEGNVVRQEMAGGRQEEREQAGADRARVPVSFSKGRPSSTSAANNPRSKFSGSVIVLQQLVHAESIKLTAAN